jgi:glycosyltransferase involved in cell wall biosynthesis
MKRKTLIGLATAWGPLHGGINSFNFDFLRGFATAFISIKVICIVNDADDVAIEDAKLSGVELRRLPFRPESEVLDSTLSDAVFNLFRDDIVDREWVCIGHDVFSGGLANALAELYGGRSAVIHHMSYDTYKSYESGSSKIARDKVKLQKAIFEKANIRLAIGPLLRNELYDWFGYGSCEMLIPSLAEIEPVQVPSKWTTILFGRFNPTTDRLKQTKLGLAGAARCEREARANGGLAKKLREGTRIKMFGIDPDDESMLREFIGKEAGAVLDIKALPFTENRIELFDELRRSSVALMPSWHEGFGLVGWEAIAAAVPIILGKDSGLFRFLDEEFPGIGTGCVTAIDICGSEVDPYYREQDVEVLSKAIMELAADEQRAKRKAQNLKHLLSQYTPKRCAEHFAEIIGWRDEIDSQPVPEILTKKAIEIRQSASLVSLPLPSWHADQGMSYSQLLRAEEACVPFHIGREDLQNELLNWVENSDLPLKICLYTGAGGSGKTRLLIESCRQLVKDGKWCAGFLQSEHTVSELNRILPHSLLESKQWVIVIDYAETRREQVAAIVLEAQRHAERKIRIVLLARDAGEWWERMPADFPKCEKIFAGSARSQPHVVPPLYSDLATRASAYADALTAFAKRLHFADIDQHLSIVPDLRAEHYDRPLYLQIAALLALLGEKADGPNGLTDAILRHEFRYWHAQAAGEKIEDGATTILHLVSLATLCGGLKTEKDAWDALRQSKILLPSKGEFSRLFRAVCSLYPGRQGLDPLRPDIVGEALIASIANGTTGTSLIDFALGVGAIVSHREHALTVLTRTSKLRPSLEAVFQESLQENFQNIWRQIIKVGCETGAPLNILAGAAYRELQEKLQLQIAQPLLNELKTASVNWDALALQASNALVTHTGRKLTAAGTRASDKLRFEYLQAVSNRALAKRYMAQYEEARADAQIAVVEFEKLRDFESPDRALQSVNVDLLVSKIAMDMKQWNEALEFACKAHSHICKLRSPSPEVKLELATALAIRGACNWSLGRFLDGLSDLEQGVELERSSKLCDQEIRRENYAIALQNVSRLYSERQEYQSALSCIQKAVQILEPMAARHPDRYTDTFAGMLTALGFEFALRREFSNAIRTIRQAVDLLAPLASARPERYAQHYCTAISHLAISFKNSGEFGKAMELFQEAVEKTLPMARARPISCQEYYAASMKNLGLLHADLGDFQQAIFCLETARVEMFEPSEQSPGFLAGEFLGITIDVQFYNWLSGKVTDVEAMTTEFDRLAPRLSSRMYLECRVSYLHALACFNSQLQPSLACTHFGEMIELLSASNKIDQMNFLPQQAIAIQFLKKNCPHIAIDVDASSIWKTIRQEYSSEPPAWIKGTLKVLSLSEADLADK